MSSSIKTPRGQLTRDDFMAGTRLSIVQGRFGTRAINLAIRIAVGSWRFPTRRSGFQFTVAGKCQATEVQKPYLPTGGYCRVRHLFAGRVGTQAGRPSRRNS